MGFRGGMHQATLRTALLSGAKKATLPFALVRPGSPVAALEAAVCLVTPAGTPPATAAPRRRSEAESHARGLVPDPVRGLGARRTLAGDARDLLRRVVQESTGVLLPTRNADDPALEDGREARDLVHLGWNPRVGELLRGVWSQLEPEFREGAPVSRGDPRSAFDSDGFALLVVCDVARRHLLVLGGSDYGTYYGVATLLDRYLGARWVFPGPDGEVIPRRPLGWSVPGDLNRYEESDFRGRSLDLLAGGVLAHPPEVDAIRTWALNNRLSPTDERVYLWNRVRVSTGPDLCSAPEITYSRVAIGKESRIPADHALHTLMSPWEPSLEDANQLVGIQHPTFYPELRPRLSWGGDRPQVTAAGLDPLAPGLDAAMGVPVAESALSIRWVETRAAAGLGGLLTDDGSCQPPGLPLGSLFAAWRGATEVLSSITIASTMVPQGEARTAAMRFGYAEGSDAGLTAYYRGHFAGFTRVGNELRFIPWAFRSTRDRLFDPDPTTWKPCVYGRPLVRAGVVPVPSASLVSFLSTRVNRQAVAIAVGAVREEVCLSVAPNDGGGWCQCDACTLSGTSSANIVGGNVGGRDSAQLRMMAGLPLFRETPNEAMPPGSPTLEQTEQRAALSPGRWLGGSSPPEVDEAAARGFFATWCCPDATSRRVADLTRALGLASWAAQYPEMYLTTHAYTTGRGAPMSGDISGMLSRARGGDGGYDVGQAAYAGDQILVYLTSTSDLREYQSELPGELSLAALQNRYPRTFNEMRWSVLTRQHGLYEYLYGGFQYMTPRLYTRSLHRALARAHRWRARAFNAETLPIWALEGPKWFEVARMLWEVETPPDAHRRAWAEAMLTNDVGEVIPGLAAPLTAVFDALETRWSRAVVAAEEANVDRMSDEIAQPKLSGGFAPAQLDAFDDFAPGARVWPRSLSARCDVLEALERTFAGVLAAGERASRSRRRVEFLLAGMEPCAVLTQASRSIRLMHRWLRPGPMGLELDALPQPSDAAFANVLEAMRVLDGWVAAPARYTDDLHGAFQGCLRRHRLVVDGASPRSLAVRDVGDEVFATHWIVLDRRSLTNYCARWNAAVAGLPMGFSAAEFRAGSMAPIAAMFDAVGAWARAVVEAVGRAPTGVLVGEFRDASRSMRMANSGEMFGGVA